ncbi:puf family RNA-binding protein [Babesia caballi]|uniref:Puf family RNA-binding protein n=1 Tax=Babesia caballi TaxID=5871 RepID=A0AAV4LUI7_BABCB|nr:puf family RNA-binding protein [Babesia caballi]
MKLNVQRSTDASKTRGSFRSKPRGRTATSQKPGKDSSHKTKRPVVKKSLKQSTGDAVKEGPSVRKVGKNGVQKAAKKGASQARADHTATVGKAKTVKPTMGATAAKSTSDVTLNANPDKPKKRVRAKLEKSLKTVRKKIGKPKKGLKDNAAKNATNGKPQTAKRNTAGKGDVSSPEKAGKPVMSNGATRTPQKASKQSAPAKGKLNKASKGAKGKLGKAKFAASQKKVKSEPKKSKEEEKKELNKLYSRLLVDHSKQDVVKSTISVLLQKIGSGNYSTLANKRHVSRILQACLKYGDTSVRSTIFQRVKTDFTLVNLNAHSARFLVKLFHYCNVEVKAFLREAFFSDRNKGLLFSRYGSDVMDVMYQKLKNKEQLSVLRLYTLSNFLLLEEEAMRKLDAVGSLNQFIAVIDASESRSSCLEKLRSSVLKMVDKAQLTASLSHDLLFVYWKLTDNKGEMISQLYKVFGQLLSTRNGNAVLCDLFGYADKKMRKAMLKGLRTDFPEAAYNQINVSFLIKAILCTDDTKLSIDCLLKPLQDELQKLVSHPYGHLFVTAILDPPRGLESATSLKDPVSRQAELQAYLLPLLVDLFRSIQLREVIENKFASQVLMGTLRASGDAAILDSIVEAVKEDIEEEMALLHNIDTLKFIQALVKKPGETLTKLRPYRELWPVVKLKANRILVSKCVFLLVDILEAAMKHEDAEVVSDFKITVTAAKVADACKTLEKKKEKHLGLDVLLKLLDK